MQIREPREIANSSHFFKAAFGWDLFNFIQNQVDLPFVIYFNHWWVSKWPWKIFLRECNNNDLIQKTKNKRHIRQLYGYLVKTHTTQILGKIIGWWNPKLMDMYRRCVNGVMIFKFWVYWVNTKQHTSLTPLYLAAILTTQKAQIFKSIL